VTFEDIAEHFGHELVIHSNAGSPLLSCDDCGYVIADVEDIDGLAAHEGHDILCDPMGTNCATIYCLTCEEILIELE